MSEELAKARADIERLERHAAELFGGLRAARKELVEARAEIDLLKNQLREALFKGTKHVDNLLAENARLQAKYDAAVGVAEKLYLAAYGIKKTPVDVIIRSEIAEQLANAADEGKSGKA